MIRLSAALLAVLCLPAVSSAQTPQIPQVLSACVSKTTGDLRLVYTASNCTSNELFIQWNEQGPAGPTGLAGQTGPTGPSGPTGPTGPAGMALNNVIVVPSTGNAATDGASLASALSSTLALAATATSPVVVQLDAGTYTPSAAIDVPAFVSLVGSGITSTIVTGTMTVNKAQTDKSTQTISSMTLGLANSLGSTVTITSSGEGVVTLDRVQLLFDTPLQILYPGNYGSVTITNSIIGSYTFPLVYSAPSKFTSLVVATSQVYAAPTISPTNAPVKILCTSDWSADYFTLLSGTCGPITAN